MKSTIFSNVAKLTATSHLKSSVWIGVPEIITSTPVEVVIFELTLKPVYPVDPAAETATGNPESSLSKYVTSNPNLLFKNFISKPNSVSCLIPPVNIGLAKVFGTASDANDP